MKNERSGDNDETYKIPKHLTGKYRELWKDAVNVLNKNSFDRYKQPNNEGRSATVFSSKGKRT